MSTPRYRVPMMLAGLLASQLMSAEAIAATVAASDASMQAEVGRLVPAQDRARRLLLGEGEFAEVWRRTSAPNDGMPIDVMGDAIASLCASVSAMSAFPGEAISTYLRRIAEVDASHPLVVHRAVLHAACHAIDTPAPDWSELDAFASAQALFAAGPQVGQTCTFIASDESVRPGTVSYVHGPTMVNLDFEEGGAIRTASSVQVVREAQPGARYVCILQPQQ